MFSFFFKRNPIGRTLRVSITQLGFLQNPSSLRSISSKPSKYQNPFVVSYLINSCGLSPAAAISASKKIGFESSDKPDSVLTLFRNHGFTEPQISSLMRKCPSLLVANATETLLPKLQFFHSVGVSNHNITKILANDPRAFCYSLGKKIIPVFNFFKSLVGTVENDVIVLKREPRLINCDMENVARNIAILRENGVLETNIVSLLTNFPGTTKHKHDRFKQMVEEIKQMGIKPSKYLFVIALYVLTSVNTSTRKQKFEAYKKWGFSENEMLVAFRRYPWFIKWSEDKIERYVDFFINKIGWERAVNISYPQFLGLSLEKSIIPRCSVLRVLILKGLVKEEFKMGNLLILSEKQFLEKFVTKYEEEVPQLLDLFKGNISLLGTRIWN